MDSQFGQEKSGLSGGVIAAIVIVVILVLVGVSVGIYFAVKGRKGRKYTFIPLTDSSGHDIKQFPALANNIPGLKAECDKLPACVGFNTNGWMKSAIFKTQQIFTDDKTKGTYVLSSYTPK